MRRALVGILAILLSYSANAEELVQTGTPMSKEQIDALELALDGLEGIDSMQSLVKTTLRKKQLACIKSFGHAGFCKCLKENLPFGLDFTGYVYVLTNTKDGIEYHSLSDEDKQLIDRTVAVRDQCVLVFY